jgi:hypothetical protein
MLRTILATGAAASLTLAGTATAAQAPTLGGVTILKAGQKTPLSIPGNDLHRGATIRKGTELRSWPVTLHGVSKSAVTLSCGPGGRHVGLADKSSVDFGIDRVAGVASPYFRRTIRVRFFTGPGVDPHGARGVVYALCRTG